MSSYRSLLSVFVSLIKQKPWTYRLQLKDQAEEEQWSNWLIQPSETWLETEKQGPYPLKDIEKIEINPLELFSDGNRMPQRKLVHIEEVKSLLDDLRINYQVDKNIVSLHPASLIPAADTD
jgi:hypothetical protein